jgi:hypothetical protein
MAPLLEIREATHADIDALASLYAEAFNDNSAYASIFLV